MKIKISPKRIDVLDWNCLMTVLTNNKDSSVECVSLYAEYNGYKVSFYAWKDSGYELTVEDFGTEIDGNWKQLKPTIGQREAMEDAITEELKRVRMLEVENEHEAKRQEVERNSILSHQDSIEHNFKTF